MSQAVANSSNTLPPNSQRSAHFASVKSKIPEWLINAPPEVHSALRQAGGKYLPWFERARQFMPKVARALQQEYVLYRFNQHELNQILAQLPSLEAFAEPLLVAAIKERFGLQVDVRKTWLFHASRVRVDDSFVSISRDPLVELQKSLKAATQTLLHAALQNFEAWETTPGSMDLGERHKAAVYQRYPVSGITVTGTALAIVPEAFAALCRELDLGGKYQEKISAFLNPPAEPGDASDAATFNRQGLLKRVEGSAYTIQVHLAYMKRDISESLYNALLDVARNGTKVELDGRRVTCSFLRLWDIELMGIVAIGKSREDSDQTEKVVVYIPDDPVCPLKEYESSAAFMRALRDRMLIDGYLDFFQRFVPARHRAELLAKLDECLRPSVWNKDRGWYEQQIDRNANLHLRDRTLTIGLLTAITEQKNNVLKDDALFHAVPTADEDQKTSAQRMHYFESLALQALNVVGFVVPPVGAVMMAVAAAQLTTEVFEGIDSWTRGEWEQGWGYLMDVVENVALMAALGAAHQGGGTPALEKITVETPSFIEELKEVELPSGETRLWKPDLAPFVHDTVLPEGLKPDEFGLYHYRDKTWISIEGNVYSVSQTSSTGAFRIEHPTKALSYEPPLRNNGAGAWLHPVDQPLEWQGLKLFRRLGHAASKFSDVTARRILRVSGTHEAVLRRVLAESRRAPALLEDTMQRFELDEEIGRIHQGGGADINRAALFESRYAMMASGAGKDVTTLARAYPALPRLIAEEIISYALPAELETLAQGRVPVRIAEEIRVYQQQVRLARAYEGLYLSSVNHPDTEKLILHTLECLPGWSSQLRLEVREGGFTGTLLDSVGPDDAVIRKVLVKYADGYEPYDELGLSLHGRDDLYSCVLHALPDAQRVALGFPNTWDGLKLRQAVQDGPQLPRETLRNVLKMQPAGPVSKSPMRLADGRLGYPLSGRGAMTGFIARDTLLDLIRSIGLPSAETPAESILNALERSGMDRQQIHQRLIQVLGERNVLDISMSAWGDASASLADLHAREASRIRIHDAIWRHWAENALPEIAQTSSALRLQQVVLTDFPPELPDFFLQRVGHVELVDIDITRFPDTAPRPVAQLMDDRRTLERFFARFPRVTSLEVSRTEAATRFTEPLILQLPDLVASSFPAIRALRLINLSVLLSPLEIDALGTLRQLEWLDLSGNLVSLAPPTDLANLRLRYLGLDRVGLYSWPSWVDGLLPDHVTELSLRNNRITELPEHILNRGSGTGLSTEISLQGNPLSQLTLMRARLNHGAGRQFRFNLDVPPSLEARMAELRQERARLQEAVDTWAEASSSTRPLSAETVRVRRTVGETIMQFWRAYSEGQTFSVLDLEGISLDDFPLQLPTFFCMRIRNLRLTRVTATTSQLSQFLANLPQLSSLELVGHAQPLPDLPTALLDLPSLTTLSLRGQNRYVDQQAITFLGRMRNLVSLNLEGNRLGDIVDVSGLRANLRWLSLSDTGLDRWPDWVNDLMPLEGLVLDHNQLTELPEHILDNPRNDQAQTEIAVRGNPLTDETMRRAHTSESYHSAYTFAMDLPADIEALPVDRYYSDSDSYYSDSDSSGHFHGSLPSSPEEAADVDAWLMGSTEENEVHRALWQRIEEAGDAPDLMALVGRLTQTAAYRTERTRIDFSERVWRVLEAADQSQENRLLYNGMAAEALVQADTGSQTCHDGAWLVFNQIEIQMFTEQALSNAPAASRGQTLYRLTRRLYRLHELDIIAREQAGSRDEAEVRLAYRLRWASELDLPLPPSNMLYQAQACIRPGELDAALARVQTGETGEPFMRYAAERDFWVQYLREAYADRFEALKRDYLARVESLPERFPGQTIDELGEEYAALKREFDAQEMTLIRELTYREGFDFS